MSRMVGTKYNYFDIYFQQDCQNVIDKDLFPEAKLNLKYQYNESRFSNNF